MHGHGETVHIAFPFDEEDLKAGESLLCSKKNPFSCLSNIPVGLLLHIMYSISNFSINKSICADLQCIFFLIVIEFVDSIIF